jgi:hypothetical protein
VTSIEKIGSGQTNGLHVHLSNHEAESIRGRSCREPRYIRVHGSHHYYHAKNQERVQQPINQTRPECLKSDTKTHKYTVEDFIGWKRMNRK